MKLLSLIIPFLNEEESLDELYRTLVSVLNDNNYPYEIIFIDDGSVDESADRVKSIIKEDPCVYLISFRKNFGKAAALQAGFKLCHGDYVVTMDADLQDDPNEIPRFIDKLNEGFDLVSGWKYNRLDPLEKRLPSKLFNKVTRFMSGIRLHDFNCGFKAYRREVVKAIDLYGEMHRYIPLVASRYGFSIVEITVNHRLRAHGCSKYGLERYLRGFFDSLTVSFLLRYYQKPMHIFGRAGLILFLLGMVICIYLTAIWFLGDPIGGRPLLLLGILFLLLGMQFFSMGFLADMLIAATYRRNYSEHHIREVFHRDTRNDSHT